MNVLQGINVILDQNHHRKPFASPVLFQTLVKIVKHVHQVNSVEQVPATVLSAKQVLIPVRGARAVTNVLKIIIAKKARMLLYLVRRALEPALV